MSVSPFSFFLGGFFLRFLSLLLLFGGVAQAASSSFENFEGKVFAQPGPNCFATALRLGGFYSTFRAVGKEEFESFLSLACREESSPRSGDLGVFITPGFGAIHAVLILEDGFVIQKPGVDYMGQTPIQRRGLEQVKFIYGASAECRRYSSGDLSLCSNQLKFYRCEKPDLSLGFYRRSVEQFELRLAWSLEEKTVSLSEVAMLKKKLESLKRELTLSSWIFLISNEELQYFRAQLSSLENQILFLRAG
jgi:hypothetical protein